MLKEFWLKNFKNFKEDLLLDLSKINNLTIFTGTKDILNPDVYKLKEKAEKNNINIDINEYQDAGHIWIIDKDSDEEIVKKGYEDLINKIN